MIERRDLLKLALGGALARVGGEAIASPANAQTPPAAPAEPQPFSFATVVDLARAFSKRGYKTSAPELPDAFANLNYETYVGIRARREAMLWANENIGFAVEPLHRGFIYQAPVSIAVVENGLTRKIVYAPGRYDFGKVAAPAQTIGDIGFSGFRILATASDEPAREVGLFQGATFARAIARGQTFGVQSRALSLRTADPRGEEFPFFRAFWIEQPSRADVLVVHALCDSESATGLFTFTIRVSDVTLIDTEGSIFPRVALDNFGIAGMQATYLHGWADRRSADDYRPQVQEANGLNWLAGNGEVIWRPLNNPRQLQVSSFSTDMPKGFGLVLRDRDFNSYQDVDARFETRPTLWMEPISDWGAGALQLVEIPSDNEIHDNIIVQWRPRAPLAAGSEFVFAYRQHWVWSPPEKPPLAIVTGTRVGRTVPRRRRFLVDFSGEKLASIPAAEITAAIWASNNGAQPARIVPGAEGRPFRVIFDLDTGNESLIELRLALMNANTQISETWLYRWTP